MSHPTRAHFLAGSPIATKETPRAMSFRHSATRTFRRSAILLACVLLLGAGPALAAPSLQVELENDAHEIQIVTFFAGSGQFNLSVEGDTTPDLAFNTNPLLVQDALNALPSIGASGGSVTVAGAGSNEFAGTRYLITFNGGPWAHADPPDVSVSHGSTPLAANFSPSIPKAYTWDPVGVGRDDERVDYTATVANLIEVDPGDALTCEPKTWTGTPAPTHSFQWLRDGASLGAANGAQTDTYTVQGDDAGHSLQCRVTGTSTNAAAASVSPPAFVLPLPETIAPGPNTPTAASSRPTIVGTGAATVKRTCRTPASWRGAPISWSFQWLRNGEPIAGATARDYQPVDADDTGKVLQCQVRGENEGGAAVGISNNNNVGTVTTPPANAVAQTPGFLGNSDETAGTLTAEIELPGGPSTYAFQAGGTGWSCDAVPAGGAQPAKAVCTRSNALQPGFSHPPISVVTALGSGTVEPALARVRAFGGGAPAPAIDSDQLTMTDLPFGLTRFETGLFADRLLGTPFTQAGGHPFWGVGSFSFAAKRILTEGNNPWINSREPVEWVKQVFTDLPRGLVGNTLAVPELCPGVDDVLPIPPTCPPGSAVGGVNIELAGLNPPGVYVPIFAIEPEDGTPAQFAFHDLQENVYTVSTRLRPEDNYAISLDLAPAAKVALRDSSVFLCSFGPAGFPAFTGCRTGADWATSFDPAPPLITNATRCDDSAPPTVRARINSWENPGSFFEAESVDDVPTNCEAVEFEPEMAMTPTSSQADSPTGLEVELTMPTNGLEGRDENGDPDPDAVAQANLKSAKISFPEGMGVNASAGHGLASCSQSQAGFGPRPSDGKIVPNDNPAQCPESSKIGTIEIETPIIEEKLSGDVHIAKQGDVGGAMVGLYLIFESPKDGILIKLPARVDPDPVTGQLVTTVDESVEAPFSSVKLNFPQGPRSPLINPPKCGTYEIEAEFVPWSAADVDNPTPDEIVTETSSYVVNQGPGGGPCPTGALEAGFNAGSTNPTAGQTSPFAMRLTREDGSDRFTALNLSPPLGMTAYLKGIPYCSDAVLASISGAPETGQAQIDNPSCPAASLVGRAHAGAGAGPNPFFVDTGKAYLAGPYKGAPVSLALVTPAVAGPLDLGNVVIRTALHVDPVTAQITAVSDPIPHILHGILLNIRDIRVAIDRPNFILNPTSCAEKVVAGSVTGLSGASLGLSNRFQVGNCAALGFKPRTNIRLFGGIKRGKYQGVRAVVRPRPGDANISRTAVRFPRSAFVAQENIRTVCTRVQYAADNCPKGSIYGRAVAWSPLLDEPLRGNVYLRSSDNTLPDAVADLRGPAHQPIRVEVSVRNDAVKGALRNTVQAAPDAPVSFFRLQMFGGKKGLIVNSRNICQGRNQATVNMRAHNGRRSSERVNVFSKRCQNLRKAQRKAKRSANKRAKAKAARPSRPSSQ